jgi:hypothetical protein
MNAVRISILNGIKNLIGGLKDYADGLPFGGATEKSLAAREKKDAEKESYNWKWPGYMRGYGPITRLCEWEKE